MDEALIRAILTDCYQRRLPLRSIARKHGVSYVQINNLKTGMSFREVAPDLPRLINNRWRLLQAVDAETAGQRLVRMVGARYLEAVGVGPGQQGWAALTECGRVVTVVNSWARVPALRTRWQVVSATHEQLLEREPICETCRFRGGCRQAMEGRQVA